MRFDVITIFPDFFTGPFGYGIVRRAGEAGLIKARVHDLRDYTHDRHRTVDDRPFGGGEGMVMKPEPLFEAAELLLGENAAAAPRASVVLLSASGKLFRQETARRYARLERLVLVCGRYEGVDERVAEHLASEEISIGDFVLSGGELPAALVIEAVTRLLPGALGNEDSAVNESFAGSGGEAGEQAPVPGWLVPPGAGVEAPMLSRGILDCPHYTRPQTFRGWEVPAELLSGNHEEIRRWRRKAALAKTLRNRPDLLAGVRLGEEDRRLLQEAQAAGGRPARVSPR